MQEQELEYTAQITNIQRNYLPLDFKINDWNSLEPYLKELLDRPIDTKEKLENWLQNVSELEAVIV